MSPVRLNRENRFFLSFLIFQEQEKRTLCKLNKPNGCFKKNLFYLNTCTNHQLSFDIGKHLFSVIAGWHLASGFDISSYFELK